MKSREIGHHPDGGSGKAHTGSFSLSLHLFTALLQYSKLNLLGPYTVGHLHSSKRSAGVLVNTVMAIFGTPPL